MILAFKLLLTPFFIAMVSLAGRRWGPGLSGLLMGLPLTSGPISLILAWQYGLDFAARAATGNLCGQASVCLFCLAYSLAAQKFKWPVSALISMGVFFAATFFWNQFSLSLPAALACLGVIILLAPRFIPRRVVSLQTFAAPKWDLPARMLAAAAFVFLLTTFASTLGPQLSGLVSPFPVFGIVLAVFTHVQQGPAAAASLMRGVVAGSWAYTCFF